MKIGIVLANVVKVSPYVDNYVNILKQNGIDFDIIEFNRYADIYEDDNKPIIGVKMSKNKYLKFISYLKWSLKISRLLRQKKYDKLIVFTSVCAVFLNRILLKKYKNNYILDIRDYSYENIKLYKKLVDKLIQNSYLTCISSKGFLRFLSNSPKIMVNHNMPWWFVQHHTAGISLEFGKPIKIGYLGMISYLSVNKKLCQQIKNDTGFSAEYYGTLSKDNIIDYCKENGIDNVYYHGVYNNKDKFEIYKNIDFINAVYGNCGMLVTSALPNKLYDCIVCKKPIIVSAGTYLSEIVTEYNLGISLSNDSNVAEEIKNFITSFDIDKFNKGCNDFFSMVVEENEKTNNAINHFFDNA